MTRIKRSTLGVVSAAAASTMLLSSCGLGTSAGMSPKGELAGPLANVKSLDGADVSVGSKQFTEQQVLGKMAVILLQSAGAHVNDFTSIPGSSAARQAQLQGQVDMEWEYTGTAWISYLGKTQPLKTPKAQFEAVKKADAVNGITWLQAAPLNNTYGFAARSDVAKKLGVTSLSDLKKVPVKDRTLCVDSEFAARDDGLQPMLKTYGVPVGPNGVPRSQIKNIEAGAIYSAVDSGACNFAEVFTTDGRIKSLKLKVLKDDKQFFPIYNGAPVVRTSVLKKHPQIEQLFAPVAAKLTDDVMIDLNAQVDVDGKQPADVAEAWLKKEGFLKK